MTTDTDTYTATDTVRNLPAPASPIHAAASTDSTHERLMVVQAFDLDGVAHYGSTDSYILAAIPIPGADPIGRPVMIPADMVEGACKADAKGTASIVIDGRTISANLEPTGKRASTLHGRAIEGDPVNLSQLLKRDDEVAVTYGVSVDNLLRLAKALGAGKGKGHVLALQVPANPLKPMIVSAVDGPDGNVGICMPFDLARRAHRLRKSADHVVRQVGS